MVPLAPRAGVQAPGWVRSGHFETTARALSEARPGAERSSGAAEKYALVVAAPRAAGVEE
ncbi:MAG TPA: hypothetical protein DD420_28880 [Streptomyces sp.]|nr:hypothetical protein [Streptomyces sp.]